MNMHSFYLQQTVFSFSMESVDQKQKCPKQSIQPGLYIIYTSEPLVHGASENVFHMSVEDLECSSSPLSSLSFGVISLCLLIRLQFSPNA